MNPSFVRPTSIRSERGLPVEADALDGFLIDSLTEYAVFAVSLDGCIVSWNRGAETVFGYAPDEVIGRGFETIFTPDDIAAGAPAAELAGALHGGQTHHDRWHVRKDGSRFWGINTVQPLCNREGNILGFTKLVRDTTVSHLASIELSDSEQRLRLLVESVRGFAIFSVGPEGTIKTWSPGARRLFGYDDAEIIGANFDVLFNAADVRAGMPAAELRDAAGRDSVDVERWLVRKDGSTFLASGKTSKLRTDAGGESRGFVKLVHDTTEQHIASEKMRKRAHFDALTELPNRQTFFEHVQRAIAILKRRASHTFAVLFVDLDHFKAVNDDFGHTIADQVLARIARRLEKCVRSEDIVSRVGGDEFAILLNGIQRPEEVDDAAQRILSLMRDPVQTDGGDVFAAVSIGTTIGHAKYQSPADVLRDADAAMYVAKTAGGGRAVVFDEAIANAVRDNINLATALRHAAGRNELRIVYQPILRLRDRKLAGFEALVRWKHPRRGLILPGEFIAQAEEANLIFSVDRWMLGEASRQLVAWKSRDLVGPTVQMSVNVSSREFTRDRFLGELRETIEASRLPAECLRLEITESTLLERSARASEMLSAVRTSGVSIDVDDFGTGYASLGALNAIFVDGLKVDWSFVTSQHGHHGWQIVESVISLAHKLGLVATAEGIENGEQLDRLVALGCDYGQGYFLSRPLGAVAATAFLRERA